MKRLPFHPGRVLLLVLAVLAVAIVLFPVYWMFINALNKPGASFASMPSLLPREMNFTSFVEVFEQRPLVRWLINSAIISIGSTALSLVCAVSAAYVLSRYRSRTLSVLGFTALVTQMLPSVLLVIPMFVLYRQFHLLNSLFGVILSHVSFIIPLCLWMMKGYFDSIDKSLEEAAVIDGSSRLYAFVRIILPIALPGVAATGIYAFIQSWDEYLFARTFVNSESLYAASVGLSSFIGQYVTLKEHIMAAAIVVTLPTLVVIFFFQRYLISGLTEGANKG